ncbi:MAG: hypothetical protein K2P93_04490 [Alphaproteobacteria bacterium]|nr:hypothetical protein [Alphaproteobacteria bacterium]
MRILASLLILLPLQVIAKAPECPDYSNKYECLQSVDENYEIFRNYIKEEYTPEGQDELIQAANDIKYYEGSACQKTCLN